MFGKGFFYPLTIILSLLLLLHSFYKICHWHCHVHPFVVHFIQNLILGTQWHFVTYTCVEAQTTLKNDDIQFNKMLVYEILTSNLKLPWFICGGWERERGTCSNLIGLMCRVELCVWNLHLSHSCQIRHPLSLLISTWGGSVGTLGLENKQQLSNLPLHIKTAHLYMYIPVTQKITHDTYRHYGIFHNAPGYLFQHKIQIHTVKN